jgi:hypothetical protein
MAESCVFLVAAGYGFSYEGQTIGLVPPLPVEAGAVNCEEILEDVDDPSVSST